MSVEKDLQVYLGVQLAGEPTIYLGGFRGTTDRAMTIISQPGPPPEIAMGMVVIERKTAVQVLARDARDNASAVETLMTSIHALLEAAGTTTMNGVVYDKIVALGSPGLLEYDDNGRPTWGASYHIWRTV